MNNIIVDIIKSLYNETSLSKDSFDQCIDKLEKTQGIKNKDLYNFETQLITQIYDFKTEILDPLLISLSQLTDIEDIEKVYQKLEDIQAVLTMEFEKD